MLCPTTFNQKYVFYAFGNTPAVSLTQDLPPEQDADILLLGCGDVRNVLFTCFADNARKIDVTCCDIEPLIHARNVLIYSLLIEDTTNLNFECIWNIYYNVKLDKESLELLDTQTERLLQMSESVEQWNSSVYGSTIRFCDVKSLSCIRSYWKGFTSHGLNFSQKADRLKQMQAAIKRAKAWRDQRHTKGAINFSGLHSAFPMGFQAIDDLNDVADHWWDCGTFPPSKPSISLNPALLSSPNPALTLSCAIHPLLGIPICTAFTPIMKGSAFHVERKNTSIVEHIVNCAKNIFKQWASAFRRAVANKSVIRIFCGDALALCFTLRNCQLTQIRSMNLYRDNWSTDPVELHHIDYGNDENAAPLRFDIIDTSNLHDSVGPLNLIPITSSLLKYHTSSCLYTETLIQRDSNLIDRLNGLFGIDVRTMSLLLGLVEPDLFTNATESFEEDPLINALVQDNSGQAFARSRLRWRRLQGSQESCNFPYIRVKAEKLAKFLILAHDAMFRHEDILSFSSGSFAKLCITQYNRASFASLVSFVKATVVSDWNQCVNDIYNSVLSKSSPLTQASQEDLFLNMHLFGVDNGTFEKPTPADVKNAVLASVLPCKEDLPDQLCITVQVPRKDLGVYRRKTSYQMGLPAISCTFVGKEPGDNGWLYIFDTVQMRFGSWHERTENNTSYPYIEEDYCQQSGDSDMFISFMVPTKMLLRPKRLIPFVKCSLVPTPQTYAIFTKELGTELHFASYMMTSKNVFITRYMPGMSALPAIPRPSTRQDKSTPVATIAQLKNDGSKIDRLIQRATFKPQTANGTAALQSSEVEVKFKSPFEAVIKIGQSPELKFKFPVPVSPTEYKIRIEKTCVKVESPLFDPLGKGAASFLFPTFLTEVSGATVPSLWTATRIDLDAMPPLDLTDKHAAAWLVAHTGLMFSKRELSTRVNNMSILEMDWTAEVNGRTDLKDGLFSILMHSAGLKCQKIQLFALTKTDDAIQTLIFPSCFRLDLVNHTVVLDTAVIPLTITVLSDPRAAKFIRKLKNHDLCQVKVSEVENRAWKAMMPALVERCRTAATWKHIPSCEYIQAGEVPLPKGLSEDGVSPICSCGVGKFPSKDYLHSQMKSVPDLNYMIDRYATRAALAPIFAVQYVENCTFKDITEHFNKIKYCNTQYLSDMLRDYGINRAICNDLKCVFKEKCFKCGRNESLNDEAGGQKLLLCSQCRLVKYCSRLCQRADWKIHKLFCVANRKIELRRVGGAENIFYCKVR